MKPAQKQYEWLAEDYRSSLSSKTPETILRTREIKGIVKGAALLFPSRHQKKPAVGNGNIFVFWVIGWDWLCECSFSLSFPAPPALRMLMKILISSKYSHSRPPIRIRSASVIDSASRQLLLCVKALYVIATLTTAILS